MNGRVGAVGTTREHGDRGPARCQARAVGSRVDAVRRTADDGPAPSGKPFGQVARTPASRTPWRHATRRSPPRARRALPGLDHRARTTRTAGVRDGRPPTASPRPREPGRARPDGLPRARGRRRRDREVVPPARVARAAARPATGRAPPRHPAHRATASTRARAARRERPTPPWPTAPAAPARSAPRPTTGPTTFMPPPAARCAGPRPSPRHLARACRDRAGQPPTTPHATPGRSRAGSPSPVEAAVERRGSRPGQPERRPPQDVPGHETVGGPTP